MGYKSLEMKIVSLRKIPIDEPFIMPTNAERRRVLKRLEKEMQARSKPRLVREAATAEPVREAG